MCLTALWGTYECQAVGEQTFVHATTLDLPLHHWSPDFFPLALQSRLVRKSYWKNHSNPLMAAIPSEEAIFGLIGILSA